jgi:hypothetical protein
MKNAGLLGNSRARRAASSSLLGLLVCCFLISSATAQQENWNFTGPRYALPPRENTVIDKAEIDADAAAATTIPLWSAIAKDQKNGNTYNVRLVGKSPLVASASASVNIPAPVIALDLKFSNGHVFRPEATDPGCGFSSTSAVSRVLGSPIYQKHAYSFGGTSVGTTQYVDAFQRANFYYYTQPGGTSPGYHVLLNPTAHYYYYPTPISVPSAQSVTGTGRCGIVGGISITWLQGLIKNTLIPALTHSFGIGATQFPVFILYNVVICDSGGCGILGFHDSYKNSAGHSQTYAVAEYDTSGAGFPDVEALSHEVGEWMNDPLVGSASTVNLVPHFGNIGQVSGCQNNLEVGDALSGHTTSVHMTNGVTYHPQQMVFVGWFYHFNPSLGVNNWYSNLGTLLGFAKPCPPGGTH